MSVACNIFDWWNLYTNDIEFYEANYSGLWRDKQLLFGGVSTKNDGFYLTKDDELGIEIWNDYNLFQIIPQW